MLEGIAIFRPYLVHSRLTVVTGHKALVWLQTAKHTGRLERWGLKLQEYNFQIIHRPGKSNLVADALSRRDYPREISTSEINSVAIQTNDSIKTQGSTSAVPLSKMSKCASTLTSHSDAEDTRYQEVSTNTCTIDGSTFTVNSVGIQTDELEEQVSEFTSNLPIIAHCAGETPKVMTVVGTEKMSEVESVMEETEEPENDEFDIEDNCCIQVSFSYNPESPIVAPVQTESDDEDDRQVIFNNLGKLQADCPDFKQGNINTFTMVHSLRNQMQNI